MNNYPMLLKEIKDRIRRAQIRATLSANAEMLLMYWDVGRIIDEQRTAEGWGTKVIQRLTQDIRNDLPEIKGFSTRNIERMLAFYREYKELTISPLLVAKIETAVTDDIISPPAVAKLPSDTVSQIGPLMVAQVTPASAATGDVSLVEHVLRLPWAHNAVLLGVKNGSSC